MGVLGMEMFSFLSDRMFKVIDFNNDNEVGKKIDQAILDWVEWVSKLLPCNGPWNWGVKIVSKL